MVFRTAVWVPGLALALASSLLLPQAARADALPEPSDCEGKAKGDACAEDGEAGSCQVEKCGRLDYSKGMPPSAVEHDCLKCVPAPAPAPAAEPAAPAAPAAASATPPASPSPAPSPKASSGCAIAGDGGGGMLALLLLVAGYRRSRRVATT